MKNILFILLVLAVAFNIMQAEKYRDIRKELDEADEYSFHLQQDLSYLYNKKIKAVDIDSSDMDSLVFTPSEFIK